MQLVYIAGRYRDESPYKIYQNIERAWELGLQVNLLGAYAVIPHKNSEHMEGAQGPQFWIDGTLELCSRCDALIVVPQGYETSQGTLGEIARMKELGKPVFYSLEDLEDYLSNV